MPRYREEGDSARKQVRKKVKGDYFVLKVNTSRFCDLKGGDGEVRLR